MALGSDLPRLFHFFQGDSLFCVTEDDRRWRSMCTHALSQSQNDDRLLGMEEYKSPFGTYELKVLVDETISCTDESTVMDRNRRKGEGD